MQIELIPNPNSNQISIKCSEDGYSTKYTVSACREISKVIRFALEDHYKNVMYTKINRILGV